MGQPFLARVFRMFYQCLSWSNSRADSPYLPEEKLRTMLDCGQLYRGELRVNRKFPQLAFVSAGLGRDIVILGKSARNRALNGDTVAVRLWTREEAMLKQKDEKVYRNSVSLDDVSTTKHNGEVVAIIKSAWPVTRCIPGTISTDSEDIHGRLLFKPTVDLPFPLAVVNRSLLGAELQALVERDLRVKSGLEEGDLNVFYVAHILDPYSYETLPSASLMKRLGAVGDLGVEIEALLAQFDINHRQNFPGEVDAEMKKWHDWKIPEEELVSRLDLRSTRIFSIDPKTARDLDDALSITPLPSRTAGEPAEFEIGVHIADVSYFVSAGSQVNNEAAERATSVYLQQTVIPMLPRVLCEELCSLNPEVDRLAFSVFFRITALGKLTSDPPVFRRTVIRSCGKLAYEDAQSMLELPESLCISATNNNSAAQADLAARFAHLKVGSVHTLLQMIQDVRLLGLVARARRADRLCSGSVNLPKTKIFVRCDNLNPLQFGTYATQESNKLVEEFMLLANCLVAELLVKRCPSHALLRMHAQPLSMKNAGDALVELARTYPYFSFAADTWAPLLQAVDPLSSLQLQKFLLECTTIDKAAPASTDAKEIIGFPEVSRIPQLLPIMQFFLRKSLKLAAYVCANGAEICSEYRHYALNFAEYTHFTSPIRRYADVLVHRLLQHALSSECTAPFVSTPAGNSPVDGKAERILAAERFSKEFGMAPEAIAVQTSKCNDRNSNAKKASQASSNLFFCEYLRRFESQKCATEGKRVIEPALLVSVGDNSCTVWTPWLDEAQVIKLNDENFENAKSVKAENRRKLTVIWSHAGSRETSIEVKLFEWMFVKLVVSNDSPVDVEHL